MVRCYKCACSTPRKVLHSGRQLHLGASETGELILLRATESFHKSIGYDSSITKLPTEILRSILEITIESDGWAEYYKCALSFSKVCKLFHQIARTLLFRNIELSSHHLLPSCRVISNLHRTLKQNPEIGKLCRNIDLCIEYAWWSEPVAACFVPGVEILRSLPNVTSISLKIEDGNCQDTWLFVHNGLRCMPRITNLKLSGIALPLEPICDLVEMMPQLQSLTIDDIGQYSILSKVCKCYFVLTITS